MNCFLFCKYNVFREGFKRFWNSFNSLSRDCVAVFINLMFGYNTTQFTNNLKTNSIPMRIEDFLFILMLVTFYAKSWIWAPESAKDVLIDNNFVFKLESLGKQ